MKRLLRMAHLTLLIAGILCFVTACEDESGGSAGTAGVAEGTFHIDSRVSGKNDVGEAGVLPDIITTDNHYLYTAGSALSYMRPSCSGFSSGSTADVSVGHNIRFYYRMEDTDMTQLPLSYYPISVYVWSDECDPWGAEEGGSSTNEAPCEEFCPFDIID